MCTHPSFQAYETLKQIQNSFYPLTLAKIQAMTVLPPSQWFLDNLYQLKGGRTQKNLKYEQHMIHQIRAIG